VKSVSLQMGTVCVLFYAFGLILSLVMVRYDERISLLKTSLPTNATVSCHQPFNCVYFSQFIFSTLLLNTVADMQTVKTVNLDKMCKIKAEMWCIVHGSVA